MPMALFNIKAMKYKLNYFILHQICVQPTNQQTKKFRIERNKNLATKNCYVNLHQDHFM